MIATGGTVGLAEGIIDDTRLVFFVPFISRLLQKQIQKHINRAFTGLSFS